MQNPVLTDRRSTVIYLLIWAFVMIMNILLLFVSTGNTTAEILLEAFLSNILFAAMGLGIWFPVMYGRPESESAFTLVIRHVFACVASVALWIIILYLALFSVFASDQNYITYLRSSVPLKAALGVFCYCTIILVYYLMIYYNDVKISAVKESRLETLVRESELSSLKAWINPHFLFNSLNSISSLTLSHPEKAQDMIIKLSEFLRYSITHRDENLTSLDEEVANLNRYIDIEKVRFGKRLQVNRKIDENALSLKLPALMLQPLMENAIKYSIYDITGPASIDLEITEQPGVMWIRMSNRFDPGSSVKRGSGLGLSNIKTRLAVMYHRDDLMQITKENDIFDIQIVIPQKKSK